MSKLCPKCNKTKPSSEFYKDKTRKDGLSHSCKVCRLAYAKKYGQTAKAQASKKRRAATANAKKRRQIRERLTRHGLTGEDYDALVELQNGCCAICGTQTKLVVDHDHSCCASYPTCGKCVRGLLCTKCNVALGMFNDQPELLAEAIRYLVS